MKPLEVLAADQGGVIDAAQAKDCGYTHEEMQRLRAEGSWSALRRGIYRPGPLPADLRSEHLHRAAAALLAVNSPDAVVAHVSAGLLYGLDWLSPPDPRVVWLAIPEVGKVRKYPGLRVLPAQLPPTHVTVGPGGLPSVTLARSLVDLARHRSFRESVVLAESALRLGVVTPREIEQVQRDCRGWPHTRRAARALALAGPGTESAAESLARAVMALAGLPTPETQVDIHDGDGRFIGRVDFLFRELRVIVEVDGRKKYDDPEVLWSEKRREDRLREAGYHVVRLTWADLMGPVEAVRARILAAFARAAA